MDAISADSHHHAVQFYRDEHSLFTMVANFLSEGLALQQPAIVIATPAHRFAIQQHLSARLIDCAKRVATAISSCSMLKRRSGSS